MMRRVVVSRILRAGGAAEARRHLHGTSGAFEGRPPAPVYEKGSNLGKHTYAPNFIHSWNRQKFKTFGAGLIAVTAAMGFYADMTFPEILLPLGSGMFTAAYWYMGLEDLKQKHHTLRRNFPVLARTRYTFESLRPEIRQYFVESDTDGKPFNRDQRVQVYQRSKDINTTIPFGTRMDVSGEGYEWINHSLWPTHPDEAAARVTVGGPSRSPPAGPNYLDVAPRSPSHLILEPTPFSTLPSLLRHQHCIQPERSN